MGIEYEYRISIKGITIFTLKSLMFQASLIGCDVINFEICRRNLKEKKVNKTEREISLYIHRCLPCGRPEAGQ